MKILVACEESQAVTIELRRLGHEAYSCDIIPCSGGHPEWHIQCDAIQLLKIRWDMIVAHPPCTYMAKAGACRMYPTAGKISKERFEKAMEAKDFFMLFYNSTCKKVAIENPTPMKCIGLPEPTQIIQPYYFGDPYSKRTCLWLKGLPALMATCLCEDHKPWMPSNTGGFSRGGGGSRGIAHNQKTASKTFPGIARAMAEQWAGEVSP